MGAAVVHPDDLGVEGPVKVENYHIHFRPGRSVNLILDPSSDCKNVKKLAFHLYVIVLDRAGLVG